MARRVDVLDYRARTVDVISERQTVDVMSERVGGRPGPAGPTGPIGPTGPTGPAGDLHYEHNQGIPAAVWNVTHSLGKFPSVTVVDSAYSELLTDVLHIDENNLRVTLDAPTSGKAWCN